MHYAEKLIEVSQAVRMLFSNSINRQMTISLFADVAARHLLDAFIIMVDFERFKLISSAYLHFEGRPHAHGHPNIVILVGAF